MTEPQKQQTPVPAGNWNRGEIHKNTHSTDSISRRKLPPYSKQLASDIARKPWQSIFIYTGSTAWPAAANANLLKPRLLLPSGENPDRYKWNIQRRDCVVISHGKPESRDSLLRLARCLLEAGAPQVVMLCPESFAGKYIVTVKAEPVQ